MCVGPWWCGKIKEEKRLKKSKIKFQHQFSCLATLSQNIQCKIVLKKKDKKKGCGCSSSKMKTTSLVSGNGSDPLSRGFNGRLESSPRLDVNKVIKHLLSRWKAFA